MDIDIAKDEFMKYASNYLAYGKMITLKINHTVRVVDLCKYLSEKLNLNEEEKEVAMIIGLLHDLARFEQWKKYQTFKDLDSIDHADLAVEILKKNNFLRKFIKNDKYDEIILNSIKYHNKYKIPSNLDEKESIFVKLIRDADKLDILYLYIDKEIDLELDENELSERVYNTLLNEKTINRKDIRSKIDRLSVSLGFVFDIYYQDSLKLIKDNNYYDTIIEYYKNKTNNKKFKEQLDDIKEVINN